MSKHEPNISKRVPAQREAGQPEETPERWHRVKELFAAARNHQPGERSAFLDEACGTDTSLFAEVESLLAAAESEDLNAEEVGAPSGSSSGESAASADDPLIGRRLGAYRIEQGIGRGGMATVYLASRADEEYQKQVAIKLLRPELDSGELLQRFRNERQTLATLDHPNIVRLLDGGSTEEGLPYLVMDYVQGTPIDEYCDGNKLSIEERLLLFCKICAAVEYAHEGSVIHRDLKPTNIMVTADGIPKLLDFGIAKVLRPSDERQALLITQTRARRMTPAYASPEQVRGERVTTATDVYSLGVVLYELLTGHRPYRLKEHTPVDIERAICEEEPEKPSTAVDRVETDNLPDGTTVERTPETVSRTREGEPEKLRRCLQGDLDTIVLMALQKEPARRYSSVGAFSEDIRRHLDHLPVKARPSTLTYRSAKFVKRHRMGVLTAALLVLVALGGAVFVRWEEKRAAERARAEMSVEHMPGRPSVAVLGFKNLSGRPETSWVSTALSEMLATELAAGGGLRTAPGDKVANVKNDLSLPETDTLTQETFVRVRKNLGSDYVIWGSYLDLGGNGNQQIRLNVRLQDAALGITVATVAVNGTETALSDLVVQAGISLRDKLGAAPVSPAEAASIRASQSSNPEALRLYSEGLAKLRSFDGQGARELLEKAVAAEPSYAMAHAALADTWGTLGYDARAREEAKKAFDLAAGLPREESLLIEGRYRQAAREWDKATEIYRTLFNFFPDNPDYGLRLAAAQTSAGNVKEGVGTIAALHKLPSPEGDDPRIDLAEADTTKFAGDFKGQAAAALRATQKAEAQGARLLLARARVAEGEAFRSLGDPKKSNAASDEARKLFAAVGDRFGESRVLRNIGAVFFDQGDFENAKKAFQESMQIRREIGNKAGEAGMLTAVAICLAFQKDFTGAKQSYERSLAISRELGDKIGVASTLHNLGVLEKDLGQYTAAKSHLEEALALNRQAGNANGITGDLSSLALVLAGEGDPLAAKSKLEECVEILRRSADKNGYGIVLGDLADVHLSLGDLSAAQKLHTEALQVFTQTGNAGAGGHSLGVLGDILMAEGDLRGARKKLEEALAIREKLGEKGFATESHLSLAQISLEDGHASDAEAAARQAVQECRVRQDRNGEMEAEVLLVQALLAQNKAAQAQPVIASARELAAKNDSRSARISVAIADARVRATSNENEQAMKLLEESLTGARKARLLELQFEARLFLNQMQIKSGNKTGGDAGLVSLEKEAKTRGFKLIARKAAAARRER